VSNYTRHNQRQVVAVWWPPLLATCMHLFVLAVCALKTAG